MKVIVDTNIVFSALLNGKSAIHDILFNSPIIFEFYSPELLIVELERYSDKIAHFSQLSKEEIFEAKFRLLNTMHLISEDLISSDSWAKAFELVKNVDENDTPFVALALQLGHILWTGDKKLVKELRKQGAVEVVSTNEMVAIRLAFDQP